MRFRLRDVGKEVRVFRTWAASRTGGATINAGTGNSNDEATVKGPVALRKGGAHHIGIKGCRFRHVSQLSLTVMQMLPDSCAQSKWQRLALTFLLLCVANILPRPAMADPSDIDAAARGVVRVVIIGHDGDKIFPVSHGTGFAVGDEQIATNAHVVIEALADDRLDIGIVPPEGGDAVYARIVAVSERNDLALLRTTEPMRLPPLTIAGNPPRGSGAVTAIGYPMNVDRAQGLGMSDIFRATPPVTAPGFLSGSRPSREFDTLLHTAPIARGNSGGPLVDDCGRVLGVNSFGAESGGTDAEFFFAVSTRELLPFLRANNVTPRINALPCRSLAELEAEEIERAERAETAELARAAKEEARLAAQLDETRRTTFYEVAEEQANMMGLAFLMLIVALAAGGLSAFAHWQNNMRLRAIAGSVAVAALLGGAIAWLARPSFKEVDSRVEDSIRIAMAEERAGRIDVSNAIPVAGQFSCVLDAQRSRVTGAPAEDLTIEWDGAGCVNARTQYGLESGRWQRAFVPANEAAVSVNRFDVGKGEYVMERYLLDRTAMISAREARSEYTAPQCGSDEEAAMTFGSAQRAVISALPQRPNERLVYRCSPSSAPKTN